MNTASTSPQPTVSTQNLNVVSTKTIITPGKLTAEIPASAKSTDTVVRGREAIRNVLKGADKRLLTVVGPCSVHDIDAARDAFASGFEVTAAVSAVIAIALAVLAGVVLRDVRSGTALDDTTLEHDELAHEFSR